MTQDNASRIKDVRRAEKAAARFERERVEGLRHLCSAYSGRLWLWRQLEAANVFSQTFTGESLSSAFNEGQRARGNAMLADLMLHLPDMFLKMMEENNARSRSSSTSLLPELDVQRATGGGNPVRAGEPERGADDQPGLPLDGADYNPLH